MDNANTITDMAKVKLNQASYIRAYAMYPQIKHVCVLEFF